jgi:hypothetical protein
MSQTPPDDQVSYPFAKAVSVVVAWLTSRNLGDLAQLAALFYTSLLIFDWFWRRFWRPFLVRRGWWPRRSPYLRETGAGDLEDGAER